MDAFATSDELENRWRPLSPSEKDRATVLLGDASVWLRAWFPDVDDRIAAGTLDVVAAEMVACAMVKRAMLDSDGLASEQNQQTMGPFAFANQRAFSNPDGNLYVTARERELLLGIRTGAVSYMSPGL
ncbi:Gp19/Gp15/Gp42 family protein [Mycolicibacterium fortuitum]|uniref:Gp19/Gp15/Gp42 family protein n=1 Tax=Mycolicibacterium fortuitum TaxID=1766 RepID=UPI0034CDA5A8